MPLEKHEGDAKARRKLLGDGAGTADGGVLRGLIQMMGPSLAGSVAGTQDGMGWYRTLSAVAGCLRPGTAAALRDMAAAREGTATEPRPSSGGRSAALCHHAVPARNPSRCRGGQVAGFVAGSTNPIFESHPEWCVACNPNPKP